MANTVDERIVAAKFDASDFEKGVNKTIKKLDELKKSLDMKEATKGVKELAEKTEVSTNSMNKSLDKLTERFTTFTGMIKQKILGGLADEVSGVFLRMEQSVTGFIRSISSDQVRAGMSKYEQMLTSVRIMMSAGESQNEAYKSIDQLREYSDQTSYSLSQMTDALSKMRAAGVDLDTATRSVEGIANACANAGINATDAQRAFYNLSQAYAKGSLNYTDYKSLELLNMTTEKFKENMLEAAVEAGTLKKVSEGTYKTISSTDKKVKAGKKVTVKNLNDMLRYDFMNNEAMNKLFGKKFYFDEKQFKEYKKRYTDGSGRVDREKAIAEAKKDFGEIAVDAYLAAREARSFTDVINTLKDVVSTGWGSTFEYLFGKLDQAKEFFTELAEGELADVVYKIGEYRNAILGFWDDGVNGEAGGKVFRQTILNITDALGTLLKTVLQILPGFHELSYEEDKDQPILESLGQKMFDLSMTIRDMSVRVKNAAIEFNNFMNSPMMENGPTRIEMIRNILSNLANVFGIIGKVVSLAFYGISRAFYTLSPIFDAFLVVMQKITEPLVSLRNNSKVFDDIRHSINNVMTILEPIANTLGQIIGFLAEVAGFFAQMAIDTVTANISFFSDTLGLFLELITGKSSQLESGEGILNGIKQDFEGIKEACKAGLGAVKDFFGALIGDIRRLFGLTDEAEKKSEEQEGGIFAGLTNFFATNEFVQQAKAWVNQAIVDVSNFIKSIPERVLSLGSNIYDTITGLFFHEETKYNGSTLETKRILTPLGEWFDQAIKDIKAWFAALPGNIIKAVGDAGKWIDEVFNEWFGHEKKADKEDSKTDKGEDYAKISKFQDFLNSVLISIKDWFKDLPNKIKTGLKNIGDFTTQLFGKIDEFLFGKKVKRKVDVDEKGRSKIAVVRYKTGFSKWLDGIIVEVKKFIKNIPTHINNAIKGVGDIISTVINALFGKKDGTEEITNKDVENAIEKPFLGINLSGVLDTIKSIGTTIINQIARIFTGTDDVEKNQEWFSGIIASGIQWIRTKAETALKWVLDFLSNLPSKIAGIFKGESTESQEQGPVGRAISDFGKTIGTFIQGLPDAILGFINSAIDTIGGLWDKLYKGIVGESEGNTDKVIKYAEDEFGYPKSYAHRTVKTGWEKFVENLGKTISHAFENLPTWIAQGIHIASTEIDKLITSLTGWLHNENVSKEMEEAAKAAAQEAQKGAENASKEITKGTEQGIVDSNKETKKEVEKENTLLDTIKSIGQALYNIITITIPTFLKEAWAWVVRKGGEVWNSITGLFDGYADSDFKKTVDDIGGKIQNALLNLPDTISGAFKKVSEIIKGLFKKEDPLDAVYDSVTNEGARKEHRAIMKANAKSGAGYSIVEAFKGMFDSIFGEDGLLSGDIGKKISDFFLVTVPKFIGKAIGDMINAIPKIVSSFSEGLLTTASAEGDKVEKKAEETEAVTVRISNAFAGILETFTKGLQDGNVGNVAMSIVKVIAVIEALKAIKEIISTINVTKNLADKAEAKNGFMSTMKRMMTAIMAAFALVAYLTTLPDDKRKDAMEIIKDLTNMFKHLSTMIAAASGINSITGSINTITETIGDVKKIQAGSWDAINGLVNDVPKVPESKWKKVGDGLASALGGTIKTAGAVGSAEMIQYGIGDIISDIVNVFERIADGAKTISQYISDTVGVLTKIKTDIDTALEVAGKAISLVQTISGISQFGSSISTIQQFMPQLSGALDLFKNSVSGRWIKATEIVDSISSLTGMIDPMRKFADFSKEDAFDQFKYGLASIGSALSLYTLEGINNAGSGISGAVAILKDILGSDDLVGLAAQLDADKFPDARNMFGASEKIVILAGAIASIAKASAGIQEDAGGNLKKLFDAVSALDIPSNDTGVNSLSGKFGTLGNALGTFANDTSGLTEDKLKSVKIAIDIMTDLNSSLKGTGQGFLEKVFEGDEGLDTFGSKISIFGQKLKSFFEAVGGSSTETYNVENIDTALIALRTIAVAYRDLNEKELVFKTGWDNLGSGLSGFGTELSKFIDSIKTISLTDEQNNKIRHMLDFLHMLAEIAVLGYGNDANRELGELAKQINPDNENGIAQAMRKFYESLNSLTVNENSISIFESFGKVLNGLGEIAAKGLSARSGGIAYGKTIFDDITKAFTAFNTQFDDMKQFFVNVKEFDQDGIAVAIGLFSGLRDFGQALSFFSDTNVDRGLNNMKWFDWSSLVDVLSENFYNAINEHKDRFTSIGSAIAPAIFEGIQSAFDTDETLRPKITPVLELGPAQEQLKQFFGVDNLNSVDLGGMARAAMDANYQTDIDRVTQGLFNEKLDEVTRAINTISENSVSIGDVTNAFANMKIVTNTDVLAGEMVDAIDARIGNKIWLIQRGISPI